MAANDHGWHEQLTPYALGLLPEEESFFLEQHLDACDVCRAQLRRLREHHASHPTTPTMRPGERPAPPVEQSAPEPSPGPEVAEPPPVPPAVTAPVAAPPVARTGPSATTGRDTPRRADTMRPTTAPTARPTPATAAGGNAAPATPLSTAAATRDRTGLAEVAVAVAAAVLFLVGIVTVAARGSEPAAEEVHFSAVAEGVTATAEVADQPWGTAIHLDIDGFVPGMVYVARVRDTDGDLVQAGTFTGVSGGPIAVDLNAAVPRDDLTEIIITERGGDIVLVAEL